MTADTGAPPTISGLAAFPAGPGAVDPRVYYVDADGHVRELSYFQGDWHHRDVTAASGAPAVVVTPFLHGFGVGPSRDPRVYYLGDAGYVQELSYFQGGWHYRNVTTDTGAPVASIRSPLAGFEGDPGDHPRVYYVTSDGHVRQLLYSQGRWDHDDVTAFTRAPRVGTPMRLAGFGRASTRYVYYLDQTT